MHINPNKNTQCVLAILYPRLTRQLSSTCLLFSVLKGRLKAFIVTDPIS